MSCVIKMQIVSIALQVKPASIVFFYRIRFIFTIIENFSGTLFFPSIRQYSDSGLRHVLGVNSKSKTHKTEMLAHETSNLLE